MTKAIFWDLMGTLGGEATGDINDFTFYPFAYEALGNASKKEFLNIVITNQSGIGKGLITRVEFDKKLMNYGSCSKTIPRLSPSFCVARTRTKIIVIAKSRKRD